MTLRGDNSPQPATRVPPSPPSNYDSMQYLPSDVPAGGQNDEGDDNYEEVLFGSALRTLLDVEPSPPPLGERGAAQQQQPPPPLGEHGAGQQQALPPQPQQHPQQQAPPPQQQAGHPPPPQQADEFRPVEWQQQPQQVQQQQQQQGAPDAYGAAEGVYAAAGAQGVWRADDGGMWRDAQPHPQHPQPQVEHRVVEEYRIIEHYQQQPLQPQQQSLLAPDGLPPLHQLNVMAIGELLQVASRLRVPKERVDAFQHKQEIIDAITRLHPEGSRGQAPMPSMPVDQHGYIRQGEAAQTSTAGTGWAGWGLGSQQQGRDAVDAQRRQQQRNPGGVIMNGQPPHLQPQQVQYQQYPQQVQVQQEIQFEYVDATTGQRLDPATVQQIQQQPQPAGQPLMQIINDTGGQQQHQQQQQQMVTQQILGGAGAGQQQFTVAFVPVAVQAPGQQQGQQPQQPQPQQTQRPQITREGGDAAPQHRGGYPMHGGQQHNEVANDGAQQHGHPGQQMIQQRRPGDVGALQRPRHPAYAANRDRRHGNSPRTAIIELKYGRRHGFECGQECEKGTHVVVRRPSGQDIGVVFLAPCPGEQIHGVQPQGEVLRRATDEEIAEWKGALAEEDAAALAHVRERVARNHLPLTVHHAHFQFDRRLVTFHYTSPLDRPNFKRLLHDGFRRFRCRIWMNNCCPSRDCPGEPVDIDHPGFPDAERSLPH